MAEYMDDFGDDDLDDLPDNALDELEDKARLSTQSAPAPTSNAGAVAKHWAGEQARVEHTLQGARTPEDGGNSDYEVYILDADSSDLQHGGPHVHVRPQDEVTERENWRLRRYGQPQQQRPGQRLPGNHTTQRHAFPKPGLNAPPRPLHVPMDVDGPSQNSRSTEITLLQARIAELERQTEDFQKAAEEARSAALSKSGEIAIVRANQQKEAKEFDVKLKVLQRQHAEEVAKARAELDGVRKEREKYETNARFLEHDLATEVQKIKALERTVKDGTGNAASRWQASPSSTPRKNRLMPLRDGFDDNEVIMVSPSKVKDRSKAPSTPKAGAKRKRHLDESAAASPALSFVEQEPAAPGSYSSMTPLRAIEIKEVPQLEVGDEKFEFMQLILDHRPSEGRGRTIEALAKFTLPSSSSTLASMIYDKLSISTSKWDLGMLRSEICNVLISQWDKCLDKKYYGPLYDLTELLRYILIISPPSLSTSLTAQIVPLCQKSADITAIIMVKSSKISPYTPPPPKALRRLVDPLHYVDFLHLLALNSVPTSIKAGSEFPDLINFWSHVDFDFLLMLVHRVHPPSQTYSTLKLLYSSILPTTFGSIFAEPVRQKKMENHIVDRISILLFEAPEPPKYPTKPISLTAFLREGKEDPAEEDGDNEPYSKLEIQTLRSEILSLLQAISMNEHGGELLATHPHAIPRLVRFLHESVVNMYTSYGEMSNDSEDTANIDGIDEGMSRLGISADPNEHRTHAKNVNTIVTILFQLATAHGTLSSPPSSNANDPASHRPRNLNIPVLLAPLPSALQRYQVALSRIAFSETWGMEAMIDPDVAEMAHELLDEAVSPEEGAAVLGVFGSFGSGRVNVP